MRIYRNYLNLPDSAKNTVLALGNFDGVHVGHQQVLTVAKDIARSKKMPCAAFTFLPHPATVLCNAQQILLFNLRNRIELIRNLSVEVLFLIRFSKEFSYLSADYFIEKILVEYLNISHVVIGSNFVFGHKRSGNITSLKEAASHFGFGVTVVEPVMQSNHQCSSTNIRSFLKNGQIEQARLMLGGPYFIEGRVIRGNQLGRKIAVPTANIMLKDLFRIAFGVYAVRVLIDGSKNAYDGIANIGIRPSFAENRELLEVHIFNFDQDLYGKRLQVQFIHFIRPEMKFENLDLLTSQIRNDIEIAKEILICK